ncbi:acyl-CoA dehydrogenase [Weissella oryzae SG25]|uniref:Acyl-CoA dehydrogenase n=2 Tax=Weissella TaxID=46255 RepID=A0A069CVL3_WEIOS|nr:acyl-CoA dehydrogenase [Weissella oryzae SG25]
MQKNMVKVKDLQLHDGTHFSNTVERNKETVRSVVITKTDQRAKTLMIEWPNDKNREVIVLPFEQEVELSTNVATEEKVGFVFDHGDKRIIIYFLG